MKIDKFKDKYKKYKLKYLNLKKLIGGVNEDCDKNLLLNFAIYNDINSLNDRKIFTTQIVTEGKTYNLDITTLSSNEVFYRGYNNLKVLNLLNPPGSHINNFKNEPTWFASPEIALIYACRNNIANLKKSYINYKTYNEYNDNDFQNILLQYKYILEYNHAAICSYTLYNDVDLVDINNTDNLKQILELFDKNFTKENYNKLNILDRITLKKKIKLFEYLNFIINQTEEEDIKIEKNTINLNIGYTNPDFIDLKSKVPSSPSSNVNINNILDLVESSNYKSKDEIKMKLFDLYFLKNFDILQNIIKNIFRKVLGFGKYWDVKKFKKEIIKKNSSNQQSDDNKKVCLSKFIDKTTTTQINSDIQTHRDNINRTVWSLHKYREYYNTIMPKVTQKLKDNEGVLNSIFGEIALLIEAYKKKEISDIEKKTILFKERNSLCRKKNIMHINKIIELAKTDNQKYKIIKFYKGIVAIDSSKSISKIYCDLEVLSDHGVDYYNSKADCKFCKLAKTTNWLKEANSENQLSHLLGLAKNFTYYEYDSIKNKPIPFAIIFENIYGKSVDSRTEARYLTIPCVHLPTMGDHIDCKYNEVSKRFPPFGAYHGPRNHTNCGANLYKKIDDIKDNPATLETVATLRYFLSLLDCAKVFGLKEYKRKHEIAECNYNIYDGNFYKYLTPNKKNFDSPTNGKLYLTFHTKANSEPHIHMHTYIDSRSSNLHDTLETSRNINKNIKTIGTTIAEEVFGSAKYGSYRYKKEDKNSIIKSGERKYPKKPEDYNELKPWVTRTTVNGEYINSNTINPNYKYLFAGSFEIMIKRILGFDNDPIESKKQWVIYTCDYSDLQPEIYDQPSLYVEHIKRYNLESKKIFDINSNINNICNQYINQYKYYDNIFSEKLYNTDDYKYTLESNITSYNHDINNYENNEDLINNIIDGIDDNTKIYTNRYGIKDDESCMTRQSVTEEDAIMVLCMEFAFINNPKIGGYFGSSAPLMNQFKNITHPELCLFNLVDYPTKININSDFASCFNTGESLLFKNRNNIDLFVLYEVYFRNCQKTYNYTQTSITKINIINTFMESQYNDRLNNPINYEGNVDINDDNYDDDNSEDDEKGEYGEYINTGGKPKLNKIINEILNNIIQEFSNFKYTKSDTEYLNNLSNIVTNLDYLDHKDDIQIYSIVRIIQYFMIKYKKPGINFNYLTSYYIEKTINLSQYLDENILKLISKIIELLIIDINNEEFVITFNSNPTKFVNINNIMNIIFADLMFTPNKIINNYNNMIKKIDETLQINNDPNIYKLLNLTFSYLYHGMIPSDSVGYQFYNN